jgi:hypothetical protein
VDAAPAFARGRLSVGMTVKGVDHVSELLAADLIAGLIPHICCDAITPD